MADPTESNASDPQWCFEEALARLEAIVHDLEEGQISLADGLARYEEGVRLLKRCYQSLEDAGRQIELLSRVEIDGTATCEPFDQEELNLADKAQKRARRRSAPSDPPPLEGEIDGPGRLF